MPRCNDKVRKESRRQVAQQNRVNAGHSVTCNGNCYRPKAPGSWIRVITCQ